MKILWFFRRTTFSDFLGMRPCKPLNGLQQGDLGFEKMSDILWLLLRPKIAFWKITSGNSSYTLSHIFAPKSPRNSQESEISMDSSVLRHFGFFELGSVAFSNFKSIHPFDDNLPDHEWKCWIFMNRETVTKAYPSLSTEWDSVGTLLLRFIKKNVGQRKTDIFLSGTSRKVQELIFMKSCLLLNASERV